MCAPGLHGAALLLAAQRTPTLAARSIRAISLALLGLTAACNSGRPARAATARRYTGPQGDVDRGRTSAAPELVEPDLGAPEFGEVAAHAEHSSDQGAAPHDHPEKLEARIAAHLGDPARIGWVKAASLVMQGSQSCVDGRTGHGVVGTPGGDAGEFLLTMATLEQLEGRALSAEELAERFEGFLRAFGSMYMHTDDHALATLARRLAADPRFATVDDRLASAREVEALLRHPPRDLQPALLEHLVEPETIGCGHLRLMAQHPEAYGLREHMVAEFMRLYFRQLWRDGTQLEFVSLPGDHREEAVLNVHLSAPVRAYTDIPTVSPLRGDTEMFVNHPEVNRWVRKQHAAYLVESEAWLAEHGVDMPTFLDALESLGARQLQATLDHLARGLPVYSVELRNGNFTIEAPAPSSPGPADPRTRRATKPPETSRPHRPRGDRIHEPA